jgi:NADH-quinone oxidoreductase subunit L
MSRWFFLIFLGEPRWKEGESVVDPHGHGATSLHPHESPPSMTIPLWILAGLSAVAGLVNIDHTSGPFYTFLDPVSASGEFTINESLTEPQLIVLSIVAALLGIAGAYVAYLRRDVSAGRAAEVIRGVPAELLERKFFVDDLYEAVFVRFGGWLGRGMVWFDERVVDGLVNGVGSGSRRIGDVAREAQTGVTRAYVGSMVAGVVVVVLVLVIRVV